MHFCRASSDTDSQFTELKPTTLKARNLAVPTMVLPPNWEGRKRQQ
jgi:hypothetical protein